MTTRTRREGVCECGDWKSDHLNGTGACRVCKAVNHSFIPNCQRYRHSGFEQRRLWPWNRTVKEKA